MKTRGVFIFLILLFTFSFVAASSYEGVELYRLWHPGTGDHFYTIDSAEKTSFINEGYIYEGVVGYVYEEEMPGTVALNRLFNDDYHDHFYTVNDSDKVSALSEGYVDEGVECYVYSSQVSGSLPLYRLWNSVDKDHFYTSIESEKENILEKYSSFVYENIEGYVLNESVELNQSCSGCPDFNSDGVFDEGDQSGFVNCVYYGEGCNKKYDLNGDGIYSQVGDISCFSEDQMVNCKGNVSYNVIYSIDGSTKDATYSTEISDYWTNHGITNTIFKESDFDNLNINTPEFENSVSVFIYNGNALIIYGQDLASKEIVIASQISEYINKTKEINTLLITSQEIVSNNLKETVDKFFNVDFFCTDSDGGKDYYTNGYVYGVERRADGTLVMMTNGSYDYSNFSDACYGDVLDEFYCESDGGVMATEHTCSHGCQDGACVFENVCQELVELPQNLSINGMSWELNYNDTYEYYNNMKNYYKSYINNEESNRYISINVNVMDIDDASGKNVLQGYLNHSLEYNLCEQKSVYVDDDEKKFIYVCKDLLRIYSDSSLESNNNDYSVTVLWISGDKLFEINSYVYDYNGDICYSYEDCKARDEERHRNQQSDIVEVLGKLIDNKQEYVGNLYLNWYTENFVKYFLKECGSDIEKQESYVGFWSCKIEPVICPPHGYQEEVCSRYNSILGKEEIREEEIYCSPGICSGCYVPKWFGYSGNEKCIPYGTRFEHQSGWKIGEAFVNYNDTDRLSVAGAREEDGVDLEVYSNNTALLAIESNEGEYVNVSLIKGENYDWSDLVSYSGESLKYTVYVDDIYYDSEDYENSYIKITFYTEDRRENRIADTFNAYCNYDGRIMRQKTVDYNGNWATCQNNYECESNFCSSGECMELASMMNELSGWKVFVSKLVCRIGNFFNVEAYDECVSDRLGLAYLENQG